ncbi:MAG: hypothetical protein WC670_09220 [Pseudolabrys sp.]|jgi:hypothetical protein
MTTTPNLLRGVRNLLDACAQAQRGERLLIVEEEPALGFYGEGLGDIVAAGAVDAGLRVERRRAAFSPSVETLPDDLSDAFCTSDHVLFLSRIGDQLRFTAMPAGPRPIVSYVLDRDAMGSPFAGACYCSFLDLKNALDRLVGQARHIHVTCPLGTDYAGFVRQEASPSPAPAPADVTVKRFPISVFSPVPCENFSGRVAVMHCLAGTGSRYYEPYGIRIDKPVFAIVEERRLVGWEGPADTVARVGAHYNDVASRFGIDRDFVHSWHAGVHPGCTYDGSAFDNLERWSGSAFGNPRLLHFHTCGAYAPGEICWNVVDATVTIDDVAIWENGCLHPERFAEGRDILARSAELAELFDSPRREIGL